MKPQPSQITTAAVFFFQCSNVVLPNKVFVVLAPNLNRAGFAEVSHYLPSKASKGRRAFCVGSPALACARL
jgi:hypothetical protein